MGLTPLVKGLHCSLVMWHKRTFLIHFSKLQQPAKFVQLSRKTKNLQAESNFKNVNLNYYIIKDSKNYGFQNRDLFIA